MGNIFALHSSYADDWIKPTLTGQSWLITFLLGENKTEFQSALNINSLPTVQYVRRFSPDRPQQTTNYPGLTNKWTSIWGWTMSQTQYDSVPNPEIYWLPIRAQCSYSQEICTAFWSIICVWVETVHVCVCACALACAHPHPPTQRSPIHSEKCDLMFSAPCSINMLK